MRSDLLDRTVASIAARARWFLLTEELPTRRGFLQAVDPGVKLVGVFALVVVTVTQRDLHVVAPLVGLAGVLAVASRIPARTFLGRLSGPPLVAAVVVAPQAVLMGGPRLSGLPLSVDGVDYVVTFTVRVAACVGFLSLLLLTTRFSALLEGFDRLRVPRLAVFLLAITYRYLLVFFAELERMVRARRSRTLADPGIRRTWRDSGNFVGSFLLRSLERGERVGRAARARGGTGGVSRRPVDRLGRADLAFGLLVAATIVGVMAA
ncbi:MAG: cobalt ECF transporter T component CbiQ [Halohasta sp.]